MKRNSNKSRTDSKRSELFKLIQKMKAIDASCILLGNADQWCEIQNLEQLERGYLIKAIHLASHVTKSQELPEATKEYLEWKVTTLSDDVF